MARTNECKSCGRALVPGQNFCGGCGVSVMADADPADPYVGRLIEGKYLIEQLLGTGAMGVVYRAKHVALNKLVAVKILRRSLVGDKTVIRRFKQEARAASRLNHPNTIQILDFGELADLGLYMAMEFIEGRDLGRIIQSDLPLAPGRVLLIAQQVLSALEEAHAAGVIHRDVKPANIVVSDLRSRRDFVKVLDFGIAKIVDGDPGESIPVTREGFVCGTPAFMSPEQVQGLTLDARTDLFSLGVVLYQVLTGELPFQADSAVEMATKIVLEPVRPPSAVRPEWPIPAALESLVLRALAKRREDRYGSAADMLADLERVAAEFETTAAGHPELRDTEREAPKPRTLVGLEPVTVPRATPRGFLLPDKAGNGRPTAAHTVALAQSRTADAMARSDPPTSSAAAAAEEAPAAAEPDRSLTPGRDAAAVRAQHEVPAARGPKGRRAFAGSRTAAEVDTGRMLSETLYGARRRSLRFALLGGGFVLLALAGLGAGKLIGSHLRPGAPSTAVAADAGVLGDLASASAPDAAGGSPDLGGGSAGDGAQATAPDLGAASSHVAAPAAAAAARRPSPPRHRPRPTPRPAPSPSTEPAGGDRVGALHAEAMRLMRQRDLDGATRKLREALRLAPQRATLHRDLGRVAMRSGDRAGAVREFRAYLSAAPGAADAATYRAIVESLSGGR